MKQLSVEEEVKHKLIEAKYQYPCTVTTFKNGTPTSKRVVTHSIKATQELIKLQPSLAQVINTYDDDDVVTAPGTIQQMFNSLGK
jgi:hypothetical protein